MPESCAVRAEYSVAELAKSFGSDEKSFGSDEKSFGSDEKSFGSVEKYRKS